MTSARRTAVLCALLAVALAAPAPAAAQVIYRWIDADGDIHYSQGIESVPLHFRSSAVIIGYDRPAGPSMPSVSLRPTGSGRVVFAPGQPIVVEASINGTGGGKLMLCTGGARVSVALRAGLHLPMRRPQGPHQSPAWIRSMSCFTVGTKPFE